jgi:diacylglycerol O-acyltransferase
MPQQHLDRLTSIDASFLHQEGQNSHMHIGALLVFEGPPPEFADYLNHVRGRLHLVPRYRQKLSTPPLESGRPLWVDDPSFNLEYHVRHGALPPPGTEGQLFQLAARIASQQLDRNKPLWESWLVEGLQDDRFALIFKTHHSLASIWRPCSSISAARPRPRRWTSSLGNPSPSRHRRSWWWPARAGS